MMKHGTSPIRSDVSMQAEITFGNFMALILIDPCCLRLCISVDDVAKFMRHMGAPFSKTNLITGAKLTLDDALDEAAAYLIRNSYPTYSKVPPVIQALRKFPLGNFVSFPAEMIRTTTTNIAMGLKMSSHA